MDVSIPSTRIDALTNEQLRMLDAIAPASSFTIAPEAGSERLRRAINKDFTDKAIFDAVDSLMQRNIQTLKLYFMVGLPTETSQDIDALIELALSIADKVWQRSKRRTVNVSISPFSPKAQTPFQWEPMDSIESIKEKCAFIKQALSRTKNIKVSYHEPAMTFLESVMARGDRGLSSLIHAAWQKGARCDGWAERFNIELWRGAALEVGIDMNTFTGAIPLDQPLPWRAISTGVSESYLREERQKAIEGISSPDCRTQCCGCGLCDASIKTTVVAPAPASTQSPQTPHNEDVVLSLSKDNETVRHVQTPVENTLYFYRVEYAKIGLLRFLGNRDMMNIFHRAFAASLLPLAYSKGFHPNPRVSFGPPLPFGVEGTAEFFDTVTIQPTTPETFMAVDRFLPDGLSITGSSEMKGKPESLSSTINAGRYVFLPLFETTSQLLAEIVGSVKEKSEILAPIATESGEKVMKNIRPLIDEIRLVSHERRQGIEAILSMAPNATCRPAEFVAALFPQRHFADFVVSRTECLNRKGQT
jgi:radical SAM-linked protein